MFTCTLVLSFHLQTVVAAVVLGDSNRGAGAVFVHSREEAENRQGCSKKDLVQNSMMSVFTFWRILILALFESPVCSPTTDGCNILNHQGAEQAIAS